LVDVQQYFADISGIDADGLLDEWRWLLGDRRLSVFRATAMGDLILKDDADKFHFLDMIDRKVYRLADSEPELWAVLTDRQTRKKLLSTFIVRGLREAGVPLGRLQCYSPDVPPILGGSLSRDNLRPCDILVHASMLGQIHQQVKDLPPGTRIGEIKVIEPDAEQRDAR
jgi:hypothetical protein